MVLIIHGKQKSLQPNEKTEKPTMSNQIIPLEQHLDLKLCVESFVVRRIKLSPDESGDWTITLEANLSCGDRPEVAGVNLSEHHIVSTTAKVTRQNIADHLSITPEQVLSDLSISALKVAVTEITVARTVAAIGPVE